MVGETTSWLAVQKVARNRGEVAIGYMKAGKTPVINPPRRSRSSSAPKTGDRDQRGRQRSGQ